LDASGTSGLVIDNLSVTQLSPAASTQSLGFFSDAMTITVERNDIITACAEVPRPDLKSIHPIGCCNDHEPDFDWYREHSWKEFEAELPTARFDPFDFGTVHPLVFHYFAPGIMLATLDWLVSKSDSDDWLPDSWVMKFAPLRKFTQQFTKEYLPLFSGTQRTVIAEYLGAFVNDVRFYGDSDVERAITHIWQNETQQIVEPERIQLASHPRDSDDVPS
jgi:hypothetical protein